MNKRLRRAGLALFAATVLAASSGCDLPAARGGWDQRRVLGYLLSFGAGWLLGQSNVATTTECRLNGEPIDCSELPEWSDG
jgi:hypothetical protein